MMCWKEEMGIFNRELGARCLKKPTRATQKQKGWRALIIARVRCFAAICLLAAFHSIGSTSLKLANSVANPSRGTMIANVHLCYVISSELFFWKMSEIKKAH
jgi:hypothetical protein